MFFALRSLFWLGLVFIALPWDGVSLRSELTGSAEAAGKLATDQAQALCLKDPLACADHAAMAVRLLAPSSTPAKPATLSQNTLVPGDLAPAWRGHASQLAPSQPPLPPRRPG